MGFFKIVRVSIMAAIPHLAASDAIAQQDSAASLVHKLQVYRSAELQEKIYAHVDRTFYLTGETLWFNLYYVDATFSRPLDISKVAYVEILNKENKSLVQAKIGLFANGGHGSLFIPASLSSGNYIFRAYTSVMKNYSPDLFFHQAITIVNPFTKLGLVEKKEAPPLDAQFFPEGGNLVAGIKSKVGFRVAAATGKGIAFSGSIISETGDTVVHFKPHVFGIGSFSFTPSEGHRYTAVIRHGNNPVVKVPLPDPKTDGYVLSLKDTTDDKIMVSVGARFVTPNGKPYCYLLVHTREAAVHARIIYLDGGRGSWLLDKKMLGDGVSHITIFSPEMTPVCERLCFKASAGISVAVATDGVSFGKRKKVTLDLSVTDSGKKPGSAHLSVAIYKQDSLQNEDGVDIRSYLLLTSELKGSIESPNYYFKRPVDPEAIDNLMLTHGWTRFAWKDVFAPQPRLLEFMPEYRGHVITGKVRGLDSTERRKVVVYMSNPDKNIRLYPSRSTFSGRVQFELRQFYGPRKLIVQLNSRLDSIYDVEISNPFSTKMSVWKYPEFGFSKDLVNSITQHSLHMQVQNTFHDLKNDHYVIRSTDTTAFYGKADEQYYLDDYTRFPTMEEVMREYVSGVRVRKRKGRFHFILVDNVNKGLFKNDPLVLLDGVPVFDLNKLIAMDPLKVKKAEVMTRTYYLGPLAFEGIVSFTTYRGDMSDFELDRRALIVDYEGLQQYREFFSPVYDTEQKRNNRIPDARLLLYWNPLVMTNAEGKQSCTFYTSDLLGKYKVTVQGLSDDGKPGTGSASFDIK